MSRYLLILSIFISDIVFADVPADQINEVNYLIEYVKSSNCIIERNGSNYPANEAVAHIERKYDYFRNDISSTEDFIEYSASKSTMSGKYYTVTCPGMETMKTRDWLLDELKRFRFKQ